MLKRLPFLCVSLLALAACSHGGDEAASAPPAAAATAPAATSAPVPAPAAPATTATPAAAGTTASAASAPATPAPAPAQPFVDNGKWVEGKNYFLIEPAQLKVENTDKIEVVEAFSYGCPACFQAHTLVDKLATSLPANAQMDYLPVAFRPDENWPVYQQAFYAAQALGIDRKTHDAMFDATWKTGETATYDLAAGKPKSQANWPTIDTMAKFYSKYGVSAADFVATANSFSVKMKMKRADDLQKSYGVEGTPTIVVNGKYRFDGVSAGGYPQMVELAQYLVAKEAAGK
jgi:thiol:disulfide interchange protein DsbA